MDDKDVLIHYGKLGMRWGRRSGSSASEDSTSVRPLKKKSASQLSNDEIKKVVNRVNLERQYKDVNPKGFSRATKTIAALLAVGTTVNAIISFNRSPAGSAAKNFVGNILKKPAASKAVVDIGTTSIKAIFK